MLVRYNKTFQKQVLKLPPAQKKRLLKMVNLFSKNPNGTSLYNHQLTGKWKGYRSIAFGGDWRAHYKMAGKNLAVFVAVGTHNQLYK